MKQAEVAERVGVSQNTISKWENDAARPAGRHLTALLAVLDVDPDDYAARQRDDAATTAIERMTAALERLIARLGAVVAFGFALVVVYGVT